MSTLSKYDLFKYSNEASYQTVSGLPDVQINAHTDVVHPEILLYIEGIQVPFQGISVSTSYNGLPEANIIIPYFAGLQEICKGYFPKVHVFFVDTLAEKFLQERLGRAYVPGEAKKHIRRLLFSGVIIGSEYSKQKSAESASVSISFRCVHKYYVMKEVIMKFAALGAEGFTGQDQGEVAPQVSMNSRHAYLQVLGGITSPKDSDKPVGSGVKDANVNALTENLKPYVDRLQGVAGIAVAAWNMVKRDTYSYEKYSKVMTDIFIPLMDSSLKVFERFTGHKSLESSVEAQRVSTTSSEFTSKVNQKIDGQKPSVESIVIPPAFKNFIQEGVSSDISIMMIEAGYGMSGEMTDLWAFIADMYGYMKYDLEVLASPVRQKDGRMAVDLIAKPLLPFYFSPACNVLLPYSYHSITLRDLSYQVPSRIVSDNAMMKTVGQNAVKNVEYRSPHDVRAAIASYRPDSSGKLSDTFIKLGEYPGVHEYARGIKLKRIDANRWFSFLSTSYDLELSENDTASSPAGINPKYHTRLIDVDKSPREDMSNLKMVWKYWDKSKPIPAINLENLSRYPGYNMEYGVPGELPPGNPSLTKIQGLRTSTSIPAHWNVIYFAHSDSFAVFPPHYDYVRDVWWMTAAMEEANKKKAFFNTLLSPGQTTPGQTAAQTIPGEQATTGGQAARATEATTLQRLRESWNAQYPDNEPLNPYNTETINGIVPYQITVFSYLDYEYALSLMETRTGNVEGPFNPFIVPGYPMDIVDPSEDSPSIHALCVAVSHQISAESIDTSITFTSGITYDELRAFELPSILPWFRDQLKMVENLSLINQTEDAKKTANQYYLDVLGVGFADPTILEDAESGAANSVFIDNTGAMVLDFKKLFEDGRPRDSISAAIFDTGNPNLSYEGNMALVRREIESQADIEGYTGVTFVDVQSREGISVQENVKPTPIVRTTRLKPGRSLFIDYTREEEALRAAAEIKRAPKEVKK